MLRPASGKFSQNDHASVKRQSAERLLAKYFHQLGLSTAQVEDGKKFYHELETKYADKIKGKKLEPQVLGIVYSVIKKHNIGIPIKKISEVLGIEEQEIKKGYRNLRKIMPAKDFVENDVDNYLQKYCNSIGFGCYILKCQSISKQVQSLLEGKQPLTVAAVIMFFVFRYQKMLNQELESSITQQCSVSIANVKSVLNQLNDKRAMLEGILAAEGN